MTPPIIATPSEQVELSPADAERLGSRPAETVDEWLERERGHFYRHESRATERAEDLLYLTRCDVEKYSEDQPRVPAGGGGVAPAGHAGGASASATGAAARAHGWRQTADVGIFDRSLSGDTLFVHPDGSWHVSGPWESERDVTGPTLARGATARDLDRHHGGESEQIPSPPQDLVGARPLDERDASVSPEDEAWLQEVERDPDVARALELERTGTPTNMVYADESGAYVPERAALHERIVEEMLKPGAARKPGEQKTAILMLGPQAAGKSTTLGLVLRRPEKFSVISADYAKERLPGYDGYNAGLLHEESTHVADHVALGRAVERGHNIVIDATGKTSSKYERMAEKLARLGYDVQALHVDVPTSVAARRAVARFKGMKAAGEKPRFSNPRRVFDTDAKPTVTYDNLKRRGLLSRAMEFNTNGPSGSAPRKVEDIDYRRAAAKRDDAPGGAPGGGHPEDARPGAGGPRADAVALAVREIGRAVEEAVRAAQTVEGPAVRRPRRVRKTVVRDEHNRIREVIEEEIE